MKTSGDTHEAVYRRRLHIQALFRKSHCQIAPYWAGVLGKNEITVYQASKRGGTLLCELTGNGRITVGGEAVLVAKSEVVAL